MIYEYLLNHCLLEAIIEKKKEREREKMQNINSLVN